MGWPMGLEPTTTGITTLDSTFELRPPLRLACPAGLEPTTPSLEGWCSIRLSYGQSASKLQKMQIPGRGERIRTSDILLPKQARYQTAPRPETWRQMILLAHLSSNAISLQQGGFSATKAPHF